MIQSIRYWVLAILMIGGASTGFAQRTITGIVVNDQNQAVAGATVQGASSKKTIAAGADGRFELEITAADKSILVSASGFTPQTVQLSAAGQYNVALQPNAKLLEDFVLVGSRKVQRSQFNSIAPVDVVKLSDVQLQLPQIGVNELLNQLVPSFNANRQSASDGTEHIDPASLRGLGPDQVLVLINGKRRHTTSLINYQNTVGNGAVGTDLNAIPSSAIDRIEVLRDGAAAQYGSDAIAGVINIILKKNKGLTASATTCITGRNDGAVYNFNANYGINFAQNKGFANFTFESNKRDKTTRTQNHNLIIFDQSALGNFFAYDFTSDPKASRAYDDAQLAAKGLSRNDFNFQVGDAKVINNQGWLNAGYAFSNKTEVYLNAGLGIRSGDGFGFRRLPSEGSNVVSSLFPNGFQPKLQSDIKDYSFTAGIKQQLSNWKLDLSNTFGRNSFAYEVDNTNNSSLGSKSPTHFNAGSHAFAQNTVNADISREFTKGNNALNLAFGAEYRSEKYSIKAGEEASWKLYTDNPSGIAGAQSFPGFSPANAVNASRNSIALYGDADFSFNKKLLVGAAARFENYSDFGSTINGKLAVRYNFTKAFAIRAAISSGFRAPSLHQQYFSNFYTDISQSGSGIVNKGIFPVNSAVAKAIGLPDLKEETSGNYSVGASWKPFKNFVVTVDGYLIDITNRIVITSSITDPRIEALGVESGRFFTNAIDTRTKGLDAVATYTKSFSKKVKLDISLAANFNKTSITDFHFPATLRNLDQDSYFGPDQKSLIETNYPRAKHSLTFNVAAHRFNFTLREVYWGKVTRDGYPFGVVQVHRGKYTTDLTASYTITKQVSFTIGAANLFDAFPDQQVYENSYFGVFKYAPVQMGTTGNFFFARVNVRVP